MINSTFKLTDSLTWRLKAVMGAIAFFFIVSALGIYLSSMSYFDSIKELHQTNQILTHSTQIFNNLDRSEMIVDSIKTVDNPEIVENEFDHSILLLRKSVQATFENNSQDKVTEERVNAGLTLINLYEKEVRKIIFQTQNYPKPLSKENTVKMQDSILRTSTLIREAKIVLRNATMGMRKDSEVIFDKIYESRFKPLYVAITLSACFFFFVVVIGFSLSRKLIISVNRLMYAADKVRSGDYSYNSPIENQDEFGLLTDTFNKMVESINKGRNQLIQLQSITEAFSFALTSKEVLDITAQKGFYTLGVETGAIALLKDDEFEFSKLIGLDSSDKSTWDIYSHTILFLMNETKKKHAPIFFSEIDELFTKYPGLRSDTPMPNVYSYAFLPFLIGEKCLGVCFFGYKERQSFSSSERDFLLSIVRQSAQALYRSFLYDDSKEAIRTRDEFLSIASHELKTPITPLKLQLQLLLRQLKSGKGKLNEEKIITTMEKSDKQLSRLSWLIDDLLDVSRISSGRMKLNFELVNLQELLREVLNQYSDQLENYLDYIELEVQEDIACEVDRFRIEQVVVNLLTNAAKYAPGKPIKVILDKDKLYARIRVIDRGPGIAKEDEERIFTRFERVEDDENIGGLGLGLYICKQIVVGHKGKIFVDPQVTGGACFVVELPLPLSKI